MSILCVKIMRNIVQRCICTVENYETAVKTLYGLQSNSNYLQLATKTNSNASVPYKLVNTRKYLFRSGLTLEKLDTLSVIHVAGTKGKGSACAYTESILREHGFKTGFFSSPHLVSVRERIMINGQPISELRFTEQFWKLYKKLDDTKEDEFDMPHYFKFLTILMFNIFLDENVDVAIIEVGIGGLYDCTNIVRKPACIGITSLRLEHTALLGNTLEEIAYQKSGIFKPGTVAFSVPQLPRAMSVLEKRAVEAKCKLHVIPSFDEYKWDHLSAASELRNKIKQQNASLAIQMSTEWIRSKANKCSTVSPITVSKDKIVKGLLLCKWPGRMQCLRSSIGNFCLDGAHTPESMECCISWFIDVSSRSEGKKILIFNTSGVRDPTKLLLPLKSLRFDKAYFVPNYAGIETLDDEANCTSLDQQITKCEMNSKTWGSNSVVANSVVEVLQDIKNTSQQKNNHNSSEDNQILVTGSLHLIGAVLAVLDPHLTMKTQF